MLRRKSACAGGARKVSAIRSRPATTRIRRARASPLVIAEDAHVIDSSNLTIEEVVGEIIGRLKMKGMALN